jgi:hypothetical protein
MCIATKARAANVRGNKSNYSKSKWDLSNDTTKYIKISWDYLFNNAHFVTCCDKCS